MEKIKELRVFRESEDLSDLIWKDVANWDAFSRDTIGKELVTSMDLVNTSIAESCGHRSHHGRLHYLYTARGSLFKAFILLKKAGRRELGAGEGFAKCLEDLLPQIDAYIESAERTEY